jgi:hypothetical protein
MTYQSWNSNAQTALLAWVVFLYIVTLKSRLSQPSQDTRNVAACRYVQSLARRFPVLTLSAQNKPQLKLDSLPYEVRHKIIDFALPNSVYDLELRYLVSRDEKRRRVKSCWDDYSDLNVLFVTKDTRRIALDILFERVRNINASVVGRWSQSETRVVKLEIEISVRPSWLPTGRMPAGKPRDQWYLLPKHMWWNDDKMLRRWEELSSTSSTRV